MKTILYQPLFINPQAYFVFPQLYHIEKGDSYIEPANITGQLIINDLTKVLTSTPTLNVVQDTNQVDFGLFKGKHIRISQYTNIGAVVLGEWYIPGTPTPPEPEQPDWFKESIVAWYSPYCKQKLTNYDVIEAYVEDFTKWAYRDSRGVAKITNNTIVITSVVETNNIVEDDSKPYSDLTIRITGVTENKHLIVRQGRGKPEARIKKDGVYTFKNNNLYFGFGVSVIGECNITITQLPTSILKDFSGNGNHAYLYGGKGKLNSGMGVYQTDFSSWQFYPKLSTVEYSPEQLIIEKVNGPAQFCASSFVGKFIAEVSGIPDGVALYYRYIDKITGNTVSTTLSNGINEIDCSNANGDVNMTNMFLIGADNKDVNITITQIPDYPDQLCYNGKMYAVCYGFPILTDYTVMAERTWFEIGNNSCFASKHIGANKGAFAIEYRKLYTENFGAYKAITFVVNKKEIIVQSKEKYNDKDLFAGNEIDTNQLLIGGVSLSNNRLNEPYIGCHGDILLFNRTLTEYEISWVKNNMMCSKQQEPDIDL